jgi:hypothetical protein
MLVTAVLRDLKQQFQQCPNITLQYAYVRAAREFCSESRWLRQGLAATLTAGQREYSLGSDSLLEILALGPVSVTTPAGGTRGQNVIPLAAADPTTFNPNFANGCPQWYAYIPESKIAFNPIPNQAYPVEITLVVQPRDGVAEIPDQLLVKWRYAIEQGARAYLFSLAGEPWADPQKEQVARTFYRSGVNEARADVNRGFQQGPVRARPRGPWIV